MHTSEQYLTKPHQYKGWILGIAITLLIAGIAKYISGFPFLSVMGQLVIAILIGMIWRSTIGIPNQWHEGISFSSKRLLRYGIILLGMRLNLLDIVHAGPKVLIIAVINIAVTIPVVYGIARCFKVEHRLGVLTACGTAICGAAAVVAIAPQMKATDDETAIGAATVAILGTLFTLMYIVLYPWLGLSANGYGIFAGATLHEIAHVIAAAAPAGQASVDLAVIVKLTRVALLVPVAILIGIWTNARERKVNAQAVQASWRDIPIPWFIVGFLLASGVHTLGILPEAWADHMVDIAYLLIGMAMAGLGLNVHLATFRRMGLRPFVAGLLGSIILAGLGFELVQWLGLS
ncbi:YeiH family protein [Paenibacillus sp. WLX2291]|uniref:YeiH family protein n=1 Tax=Paenibacillus sp. WLX2291 TaxID=3296934 RepID=UPI00398424A0